VTAVQGSTCFLPTLGCAGAWPHLHSPLPIFLAKRHNILATSGPFLSSTSTGMGQLAPGPSHICFTLLYLLFFLVSRTETLQHFCLQGNNMKVTSSCSSDQSENKDWVQHSRCQVVIFSTVSLNPAFFLRGLIYLGLLAAD